MTVSVRDGANVVATKALKASKAPPSAVAFGGEQRTRPRFVPLFPLAAAAQQLGRARSLPLFKERRPATAKARPEASEYLTLLSFLRSLNNFYQ